MELTKQYVYIGTASNAAAILRVKAQSYHPSVRSPSRYLPPLSKKERELGVCA